MSTFEPVIVRTFRTHEILPPRLAVAVSHRRRCPRSAGNMALEPLADLNFRSSTARGTCSVASPAPSLSSCSTDRRLSLCAARPSTSPASSSAPSVRPPTHTDRARERRAGTLRGSGGCGNACHVDGIPQCVLRFGTRLGLQAKLRARTDMATQ
jgi:hypothetical protein